MPRPYIGPKVDFRLPMAIQEEVERYARDAGMPVDAYYRELVYAGIVATAEERLRAKAASRPARVGAQA
jgi:hypothetical protein